MEKTNTEYINQIAYDMIYLAAFGINSKCKRMKNVWSVIAQMRKTGKSFFA